MSSADTVRVEVRGFANPTPAGNLLLAIVSAPEVGIHEAALYIEGSTNNLVLRSACGCATHAPMSQLVMSLARIVAESHDQAARAGPAAQAMPAPTQLQ